MNLSCRGDVELLNIARQAWQKAYAPYSQFRVGAALRASSGEIYTGCNIENCSYGLTICAERVALGSAVAAGEKEFITLAVAAERDVNCIPCGACLQVMAEFCSVLRIVTPSDTGGVLVYQLSQLMPKRFSLQTGGEVE